MANVSTMVVCPSRRAQRGRRSERAARRTWKQVDAALHHPSSYRHPAGRIQRIETHISVIYLAGHYAYKIKKPVDIGFVDFTLRFARSKYCNEQVRLNRRFTSRLYLGVIPIARRGRVFRVGATGTVVEHAIRMRRFDEANVFASRLARGKLDTSEVERLAHRLAACHRRAPQHPPRTGYGSAAEVRSQMQSVLASLEQKARVRVPAALRDWCASEGVRLEPYFEARRAQGFVRECHGDLHLENIVQCGGHIAMFDGVEFSEALRWIDVAADLAFPVMHLQAHGRDDLASAFLNSWLQQTGDYGALPALRFYSVYRALVRSLVEALKGREKKSVERLAQARRYIDYAERLIGSPAPRLLLCHGFSGSGKSVASAALAVRIGAIRLSSDAERNRAGPLDPPDFRPLPASAYTQHAIDAHYERLCTTTGQLLRAGCTALVDATFLQQRQRARFIELATALDVPVFILDFHASSRRLAERVRRRGTDATNFSDAGSIVLVRQFANEEPLTPDERALSVRFDTDVPLDAFNTPKYWQPLLSRLYPRPVRPAGLAALEAAISG